MESNYQTTRPEVKRAERKNEMTILITYKIPTFHGNWREHTITANSLEKAEEICKTCETLGYVIKDVTREE